MAAGCIVYGGTQSDPDYLLGHTGLKPLDRGASDGRHGGSADGHHSQRRACRGYAWLDGHTIVRLHLWQRLAAWSRLHGDQDVEHISRLRYIRGHGPPKPASVYLRDC